MVQITLMSRTLASSPQSECASCCQQVHAGSKCLLQQNHPVLNCGWQLTQVVIMYNDRKMVVVMVLSSDCYITCVTALINDILIIYYDGMETVQVTPMRTLASAP